MADNEGATEMEKSEIVPSHRCKECGALWRFWLASETGFGHDTWSLHSKECGKCCDNVAMGDQIEPLTFENLPNG